jgi:hypothetical protein
MFEKPLPRVLFGYIYGSMITSLLVFYFAPIQYVWKIVLMLLLASPYLIGIPGLELCLLARERRLISTFKRLLKPLPFFIVMNLVNYAMVPDLFWRMLFPMNLFVILSAFYGSWGGRMIKLGYFGEFSES